MATDDSLAYVAPGEGEAILVMADLVTVKVRNDKGDNPFALTEVSTPPQGGPPSLHRHLDAETFYVIEGRFRFDTMQGDQPSSVEGGPGTVVHIPSMVWHNYKNVGETSGRMAALLQPGDMIDFFPRVGHPRGRQGESSPPFRAARHAAGDGNHAKASRRDAQSPPTRLKRSCHELNELDEFSFLISDQIHRGISPRLAAKICCRNWADSRTIIR